MNNARLICALLVMITVTARSQVASHAPTGLSGAAAQDSTELSLVAVGRPVARVNGAILTDADLVREEYAIFPYARQHNGLPKDLAPQIRDGAMKMIIFEELVYQEAVHRKLLVPEIKLQRAEVAFRKEFATPAEFNALMQSEFHGSQELLREKIRRSLMIEALLKAQVDAKGKVTPAEVRAFYDKNPERFKRPELFTFQTISILPPAKPSILQGKEGRKRADDALHQAKATKTAEEFGLLAEKSSDDDYRVMMGQHKPMPAAELAPQVLKALKSMKVGEVSNIIQMDQAYTILRLNAHTPAGKAKFEEERAKLTKDLQQSKTNRIRSELDAKLRQGAKIEEL